MDAPWDLPYALKDPAEMARRRAMLAEPHVEPLATYRREVQNLVGSERSLPDFDPCDGGVNARLLFLLEAPGRRAVSSSFVSRNNPDQTAKNLLQLLQEAGLPRSETVLWNIVPWYVGDGQRIRAVEGADLDEALPHLETLIDLLPNLEAVVLVGKKAAMARAAIARVTSAAIYVCAHPSPKVFNIFPHKRAETLAVLSGLKQHLQPIAIPSRPIQSSLPMGGDLNGTPDSRPIQVSARRQFSPKELRERAFLRAAVVLHGHWEEGTGAHTRLFETLIPDGYVFVGSAADGANWREHVVPCAVIRDQCFLLLDQGKSTQEVADFIEAHLKIVMITREQRQRLDFELGHKTSMPEGWLPGDIMARLRAAGVELPSPRATASEPPAGL